jgi:hypothetical protein
MAGDDYYSQELHGPYQLFDICRSTTLQAVWSVDISVTDSNTAPPSSGGFIDAKTSPPDGRKPRPQESIPDSMFPNSLLLTPY